MNKTWYEDVKEDFVKNIKDSYTLNLAISILEDRKELLEENLKLRNKIDKAIELYKNCKAEDYCTLDLDMYNALIGGDVDE